jgi:hypothetical protein
VPPPSAPAQQSVAQAAFAEVTRQVPSPAVLSTSALSLVNIQALLWVDTAADRDLGTVTLLGDQVRLRIRLVQVAWDFGDGSTDTSKIAGHAFDPAWSECKTKLCPDYFGHVFIQRGVFTVRARVTWSGQFQVAGGTWQDITGTATGAPSSTTITVREARGVLVTTPDEH